MRRLSKMPPPDKDPARIVADALDSGLIILDGSLRVAAWNSWVTSASGIAYEDAIGKTLEKLFAGPGVARLSSAVSVALEGGASRLLTHTLHPALLPLKTRAGQAMIHDVTLRPVGDAPNTHCLVQIVDVTVAVGRERVLRQRQNARYDAVVDSAVDPILTLDMDGRIQLANAAAAREFGYAPDELMGRPLTELLDDAKGWKFAWVRVLTGLEVHWPVELAVRRKDGTLSYVDASASRWQSDSRAFVTAILRDVNERRASEAQLRSLNETLEARVRARTSDLERAHEQLRQSQKMEAVGQLTGGIAHDFNNLLTPILGGLDILHRRGLGDARSNRLIDGALQSAERARTLVQRLLAFARQQPLQASAVDLGQVVRDMTELVGSTLGPRIRLVTDIAEDLPRAMADPNQLEMALLNLAVNARDAMADGGTLTLGAQFGVVPSRHKLAPGRYVRLSVSDTGTGMDAATLAKAIEPFFSTKEIGKGTGLGLSMIHGLAAQLGGALDLSSTVGVGTTVDMWLPVAEDGAAVAQSHEELSVTTGAGIVLLVDDEDLIRASTAQMLADLGYEVIEAASAKMGLHHLEDGRIDLVVTDHLMPGMTGAEFAREVQAKRPGLPILIISGFAELEDLAPDLPRLTKPFRQGELAAGLAALR
jgi:PAS domain S-box-containing protein